MDTETETQPNSSVVRSYIRTARTVGSREVIEIVTLHAFCSCFLRKGPDAVYGTLAEARAAVSPHAQLCQRSPRVNADAVEITDERIQTLVEQTEAELAAQAAEGSQDPQDVAAPAETDEPVQDEPLLLPQMEPVDAAGLAAMLAEVSGLLSRAAEPGLDHDEVRDLLSRAALKALDGHQDDAQGHMVTRVENMDNAGASRRDGLVGLVHALGGATDVVTHRNETGSGIYWFEINIYAPLAVVNALEKIIPVLMDRARILLILQGRKYRRTLREQGTAGRDYNRAATAYTRTFLDDFLGRPGRDVAAAVEALGWNVASASAALAAAQAQGERLAGQQAETA